MSAADLWPLLARPFDAVRLVEALLGVSPSAARMMVGALHASSEEADTLLEAMPRVVRSLAIAAMSEAERSVGEVRGPIQWGETMSARSASAGDPGIFVCAVPQRAYDTPENRVLASALRTICEAADAVDIGALRHRDSALSRHIRRNGIEARWYLDHRALSDIRDTRPTPREKQRTRAGLKQRAYAPALAVLDKAAEPITGEDVDLVADPRSSAQHAALAQVVEELRRRGHNLPLLRVRQGALVAGMVRYVHDSPRLRPLDVPGIHVGDLLLDVAVTPAGEPGDPEALLDALEQRGGGRPCAVLAGPGDLAWALDQMRL